MEHTADRRAVGGGDLPLERVAPRRCEVGHAEHDLPAVARHVHYRHAAGNFVDVFFQNSGLDRKQIVASKSATQTINHALRVLYFGSFAGAFSAGVPWWGFIGAVGCAMAGTTLAGQALHRMSDSQFRQWSRLIINSIAAVFVVRGTWLLLAG